MPRKYQHRAGFEGLPQHNSVSQIPIKHGTAMSSGIGHSSASSSHPAEMPMISKVAIPVQFNYDQAIVQDGVVD